MFCKDNGIELSHGAPQTLTTQGLSERSNLSWKQDMRSLIVSTADKNIKKWCQYTREASYARNISNYQAIKVFLYEAVYGIRPHSKKLSEQREERNGKSSQPQHDEDQPRKDKKNNRKPSKIQPSHGEPQQREMTRVVETQMSWRIVIKKLQQSI